MKIERIFRIAIALLICFTSMQVTGQTAAKVKKYATLPYNGMAKILIRIPGPTTYDSVYFKNGVGTYHCDKYEGEIGWLYITDVDRNMVHYMILEKGTITITATSDSLIFITGTPNNNALFTLDEQIEPLRMQMKTKGREVRALRVKGENDKADKLQEEILQISNVWWGKQTEFALNNKNMAGLNYVNKLMTRFSTSELKKIMENYQSFSDRNAYKTVQRRYNAELKTDVGVTPPPFTLVSDRGDMVSLSKAKKRLTIVDFWASWCKPCRAENPNMIRLYDQWKNKGLEIISVSIDKVEDKQKWLDAIKEDKITWVQLWDEKGEVNKAYGITAIPRTFLIDENGVIIQKDLRGEELNKAVEKILGQ